jgi:hypothetical protein
MNMFKPSVGKIVWLIKQHDRKIDVVGYIKGNSTSGALIIGSSTGTYCTGHGESWKSKWQELLDSGYIVDVIAKKKGKIPHDWNPPVINKKDKQIVSIFQGGEQ